LWAKANPKVVEDAMEEHAEKNPDDKDGPGPRRSVICRLFKELSNDKQVKWRNQAEQARKLIAAASAQPLQGEERSK
jgi:hypothetical protein